MKFIQHINTPDGSREHVISWSMSSDGRFQYTRRHCNIKNCEINLEKPFVRDTWHPDVQPYKTIEVKWYERRGWRRLGNGARTTTHVQTQNYREG